MCDSTVRLYSSSRSDALTLRDHQRLAKLMDNNNVECNYAERHRYGMVSEWLRTLSMLRNFHGR